MTTTRTCPCCHTPWTGPCCDKRPDCPCKWSPETRRRRTCDLHRHFTITPVDPATVVLAVTDGDGVLTDITVQPAHP